MNPSLLYPREGDTSVVYLKQVVDGVSVIAGDFTMYQDFEGDPRDFQKHNVLYHYPVNHDRLIIGKFCSLGCGTRFLFTSGNHAMASNANYPFPIFYDEWGLSGADVATAWDNKGDTVVGNDVWFGYHATVMSGVHIGDGAVIGTNALVTKDVPPYTIVGGCPAKPIRKRFDEATIERLLSLRWWDWEPEEIKAKLPLIQKGLL